MKTDNQTTEFTRPLVLEYLDGCNYKVLRTFPYVVRPGEDIQVPKGFVTDFASVPRFLWRVVPPTGIYGKAAVIHDYLYRTPDEPYSRAASDLVFLEAMEELDVPWWKRTLMYYAVRCFGRRAYRERTQW